MKNPSLLEKRVESKMFLIINPELSAKSRALFPSMFLVFPLSAER